MEHAAIPGLGRLQVKVCRNHVPSIRSLFRDGFGAMEGIGMSLRFKRELSGQWTKEAQ